MARWRLQVIADQRIGPRLRGSLRAEQDEVTRAREALTHGPR